MLANADTYFGKSGINWPYGWTIIHWSPGWKYMNLKKFKLLRTVGEVLPIVGAEDNPNGGFTVYGVVNLAEPGIHGKFRVEKIIVDPSQSVTVGTITLPLIIRELGYMTLDEVREKFGYDLLPWVINTFYPWPAYFPGYYGYMKEARQKYKYNANNGRWEILWQSCWPDFEVPEIRSRVPYVFIMISKEDADNEGLKNGDIVEVYNDYGTLTGVIWISNTASPGVLFIAMANPHQQAANLITLPNVDPATGNWTFKMTWANIKKIGSLPEIEKEQLVFVPIDFRT